MKNGLKIDADGAKFWYLNGKLSREGGPAVEYANGDKVWYLNNKLSREDGPAIEYANGYKAWYLNGKEINCSSQEEFLRLMKLKAFW
jgi:endo-1,4-beta-mannosidase